MSVHWITNAAPDARPILGDMAEIIEMEAEARRNEAQSFLGLLYALPVSLAFWGVVALFVWR